jgi:hypothetical protein
VEAALARRKTVSGNIASPGTVFWNVEKKWRILPMPGLAGRRPFVGYFDALTSTTFRTTDDGQRLFFPWGSLRGGYVVASEADYERLRRLVKAYLVVALVLIIGLMSARAYLLGFAAAAAWCALYIAWATWTVRGLQRSNETLTLREATAVHARAHSALFLWAALIVSLGFVASGVFVLAVDPGQWLIAASSILFFGFCVVRFLQMITLRRSH